MQIRSYDKKILPKSLEQRYATYSFVDFDDGSAFAYDSPAEWAEMTIRIQERMYDVCDRLAKVDPRLAAQEREFTDKLAVCWRMRGLGTLFVEDPATLSCHNVMQAEALRPVIRDRGQWYVSQIRSMGRDTLAGLLRSAPLRIDRGKGAPYWFSGTERETPFAVRRLAQAAPNLASLKEAVSEAGQARAGYVQTSDIRIQSARGPVPRVINDRGALRVDGERIGPKVRRIAGQPFVTNHLWAAVGNVLRTIMASDPAQRTTGTFDPAAIAARKHRFAAAVDLKSYDTTVSYELQLLVHEEMLAPATLELVKLGVLSDKERAMMLEADLESQRMPILLPPRDEGEVAYEVAAEGQTRSGENLTSWKGTEINRARCDLKARLASAATGQRIHAINYGDDTVVFADSAAPIDHWLENGTAFGFKEVAAPDATFLMKRVPFGYSYLGRMVMGSIDREVRQEPETQLDAAAAFALRYQLLKGHPMQDEYWAIMEAAAGPQRLRNAVALAKNADAVALTLMAAEVKSGARSSNRNEDRIDALEALLHQPLTHDTIKRGAARAILLLQELDVMAHRQISWSAFNTKSAEMSIYEARALIRAKSYVIGMNRI